ncbi:MAG: metallophosphoesterase family protein [Bacillota bacterium]
MKIGILSDTHGNLSLAREALKEMGKIDLLFHGGDYYTDACQLAEEFNVNVKTVVGNCDFFVSGPKEEILTLGDYKIFLTHGHQYGVKGSLQRLFYRAEEIQADIVVYGHTHIPLYSVEDSIHFINPGSISLPRGDSRPSYGILMLGDEVKFDLREIVK